MRVVAPERRSDKICFDAAYEGVTTFFTTDADDDKKCIILEGTPRQTIPTWKPKLRDCGAVDSASPRLIGAPVVLLAARLEGRIGYRRQRARLDEPGWFKRERGWRTSVSCWRRCTFSSGTGAGARTNRSSSTIEGTARSSLRANGPGLLRLDTWNPVWPVARRGGKAEGSNSGRR